jgi:hypothetical protein
MDFQTLMQAGPAKVNELFARLAETSDGAVKTREKLFTELKNELELHTSLEGQHLFPILRRNPETKELVAEAIKDNKELRAKLDELEALPKGDEAFPERLKELQKTFRQHARDEKRELLPAVKRALSEKQMQGVAEKIEAGIAEADQARQDEVDERRVIARQEREQAERQAERQAESERVQKAAAEQARHDEAAQKRATAQREREERERQAERQAESERVQKAAAEQARHDEAAQKRATAQREREERERQAEKQQEEGERRARDAAEAVACAATAAQTNVLRMGKSAAANAERVGEETKRVTETYVDAAATKVPDLSPVASLPKMTVDAMMEIRSTWIDWTIMGTRMSQELLRQATEQQRRFAVEVAERWMEHSTRVMQIVTRSTQEGFRPVASRRTHSDEHRSGR